MEVKEVSWIISCTVSGILSGMFLTKHYKKFTPIIVFLNHILLPLPLAISPPHFVQALIRWNPRSIIATFISSLPLMGERRLAILIAEAITIMHLLNFINTLNSWIEAVLAFIVIGAVFGFIDIILIKMSIGTIGTVLCGAILGFLAASIRESIATNTLLNIANFRAGLTIIQNLPYAIITSFATMLVLIMFTAITSITSRPKLKPKP